MKKFYFPDARLGFRIRQVKGVNRAFNGAWYEFNGFVG